MINDVSIDLIKLDRFEAMIQDIIEADNKHAFDQPIARHRKASRGKVVTSPKLCVCLTFLLCEFHQMRKPMSPMAHGLACKANTRCQAFCFSAISANPDLGEPDEGQAPVSASQTAEGMLNYAQPTDQATTIVTLASQTLTCGTLPNQ
jgi:hypothetical protein